MSDFNPDRINLAVECRGWTKKELAARCDMSPVRISNLSNGKTGFDEAAAERIALVTGFPVNFFLLSDERMEERHLTFRRTKSMKRPIAGQVAAEFGLLANAVSRIEAMSARATDGTWLEAIAPRRNLSMKDIERLAGEVRTYWGLTGHGPVRNVTRSIERSGIAVVAMSAPVTDGTGDGVTSPSIPHASPIIGYFPQNKPGDRQRFTLAHELGHLVLHRFRLPSNRKEAEFEAHAFAGSLLMPECDARATLSRHMSLNDYAVTKAGWGVSIAALITRALRLGIIDDERRRSLSIQIANRRWNRKEPVQVKTEHPSLLKQMVGNAFGRMDDYRHPAVSRQAIEGFLGLPFDMVNEWCGGALLAQDDFTPEAM